MTVFGQATLLAVTISVVGCGSSEPSSPLILGRDPADVSLGARTLTASQARALRTAITSAGETCGAVTHTFLSDLDPAGREAWEVRCTEASYSVQVRADAAPNTAVQRCVTGPVGDRPCMDPYARATHHGGPAPDGPLNPELKKLLEPMTAKDRKSD